MFSTWIYTIKLIHLFDACVQYVDVIFFYMLKKSKQQIHSKYEYTTTSCFFKTYIDNYSEYEDKIIDIIKGYAIPYGMPWHLKDDVNVTINNNGEFHWILAVVALKEQCIKVIIHCSHQGLTENFPPRSKSFLQCCQSTLS